MKSWVTLAIALLAAAPAASSAEPPTPGESAAAPAAEARPEAGAPAHGLRPEPDTDAPASASPDAPSAEASPGLDARFAADEASELDGYTSPGFGRSFLEMLVVLGMVCLLAYFLLGKVLPKLLRVPTPSASGRLLTVVDRLPIDPRRSLMVVKMGEQHFLVGCAEQGLHLLARLDPGEVRDAMAAASLEARPAPWAGWTSLLKRRAEELPR